MSEDAIMRREGQLRLPGRIGSLWIRRILGLDVVEGTMNNTAGQVHTGNQGHLLLFSGPPMRTTIIEMEWRSYAAPERPERSTRVYMEIPKYEQHKKPDWITEIGYLSQNLVADRGKTLLGC
ncbi:hypothetical protein OS493_040178 [Desmophyllum pertusum]|uniref:Uncharacterized protein n=1 Tax=Desmophyllum pertusum TaxID=174260 RepID=A0A9X0D7S9_9CNID|nr:hypothetical protein OS493_040178 [Desmophyllum pertusum]